MHNTYNIIGQRLIHRKDDIAEEVTQIESRKRPHDEAKINSNEMKQIRAEAVVKYGTALQMPLAEGKKYIAAWTKQVGEDCVKLGYPLETGLDEIQYLRKLIAETIKEEGRAAQIGLDDIFTVTASFNQLFDKGTYSFCLSYVEKHNKIIRVASESMTELSVPLVPVTDLITVLPLVGEIDSNRARVLLEATLKRVGELKPKHLVIDISGVSVIDTMVAQQIHSLIAALNLLGIDTAISGIRPEIAQTVTGLGLSFNTRTYGKLKSALASFGLTALF